MRRVIYSTNDSIEADECLSLHYLQPNITTPVRDDD